MRKILKKAKIKPLKVTYYCEKRDSDFEAKMHDVLVIYKQFSMQFNEDGNLMPFEGIPVHTLSYDEKPEVQTIGTATDDRPPIPARTATVQYGGITNTCGSERCPSLQELTCLQERQSHI